MHTLLNLWQYVPNSLLKGSGQKHRAAPQALLLLPLAQFARTAVWKIMMPRFTKTLAASQTPGSNANHDEAYHPKSSLELVSDHIQPEFDCY